MDRKVMTMGIQLEVETSQLTSAGNAIDGYASQYEADYRALISAVESVRSTSWNGTDAETFVNKVKAFEDDFQKMVRLLKGAASDLKKSAQDYERTQQNAVSRASKLKDSVS